MNRQQKLAAQRKMNRMGERVLDKVLEDFFWRGANAYREAAAVVLGLGEQRIKRIDEKFNQETIERWLQATPAEVSKFKNENLPS